MIAENNFFMKIGYNQSDQHARILLASLARYTHRAHENFRKKSVSQSTQNALKRKELKKITPLTHYALRT